MFCAGSLSVQTGQQPVLFRILFCETETNTVRRSGEARRDAAPRSVQKSSHSHREARRSRFAVTTATAVIQKEHVSDQDHRKDPHTPTSTTAGVTGNVHACVCVCVCERSVSEVHIRGLFHTLFSCLGEAPHSHKHASLSAPHSSVITHRHTLNTHSRLLTSAQRPISGFEEDCLLRKPDTHTPPHTHTR